MQYGFLIDHRKCIGCHACTVACKAENNVPVGSFRTWVKYTEQGTFPDVTRDFSVLRCNHCTDAPCVTICPVTALEKEDNGIVDLDRDICIGCRACMQACPYDALYLNEDRGSVEKCHYCAHRVENGLEPACVVVCPEQAIVAGDLEDAGSQLAQMVSELETEVRRPEQNTGPNVHYVGHNPVALQPGRASTPETFIWSDRPQTKPEAWPEELDVEPETRTVLDTGHKVQWGAAVALYLVTKGIAAGAAMLAPFAAGLGLSGFAFDYLPEILALVFASLTTFLLVEDLTRPAKFLTLLTRGNQRSWLVRGAYVLIAFSGVTSLILFLRFIGQGEWADMLRWVNLPLGLLVAGYTAFLFQQCEGRDLWQGKALLPHLLTQALLLGAVCLLTAPEASPVLAWLTLGSALAHAFFALRERFGGHPTDNARQAAAFLGSVRTLGTGALREGLILCLALGVPLAFVAPQVAFIPVVVGIYLYEWAFIRAGQLPPLS